MSEAERALRALREAGLGSEADLAHTVEALGQHAPALLPLVAGRPELLAEALRRDPRAPHRPEAVADRWRRLAADRDEASLAAALRTERHLALLRVALREAWEEGDVRERAAEWSDVAAGCIDAALAAARRTEERRAGPLVDAGGEPIGLVAMGMGKLGGRELNLGSDVDLCFFYATDETPTDAPAPYERFARIVRHATKLLSEVRADGFCFRVDLRLRPEGRSGPLVNSLASAERYYETWGRPWERAVWLRARPIAGDRALGRRLLTLLEPFVFPRRVDPGIVEDLHRMLLQSRRGHRAGEEDVKLGPGGIREAEFFVQGLQLVWGGRHPEVRSPGTLEGLARLLAAGLVSDREAEDLEHAWLLLRRVEHRIHLRNDHPTHRLPADPEEGERLAASLGFGSDASLRDALRDARRRVQRLFASLRPAASTPVPLDGPCHELARRLAEGGEPDDALLRAAFGEDLVEPDESLAHLRRLARRADGPLGSVTLARHPDFPGRLLREVADSADPVAALGGLADFFARCGPPDLYVRLLADQPRLLRRLVSLLGASRVFGTSLVAHPESLDALLTRPVVPSAEHVEQVHLARLAEHAGQLEPFVETLRALHQEETLRVALAYAAGDLDAQGIEAPLTALAEAQVRAALRFAAAERGLTSWPEPPAGLAVVGLGKLGSREMGFGSDLDVFFVHDEQVDPERGVRAAQRTLRILSQPAASGRGYVVDTRLRPSGSHGLLVVGLRAFERYHRERAAPWERQALLRARVVAGAGPLLERLEPLLVRLPYEGPPPDPGEVARLRARMQLELAAERADRYHAKLGYGALLDVEFLVQVLQMRLGEGLAGHARPARHVLGHLADAASLEPGEAARLAEALRFFRSVEQAIRFHDPASEPFVHPSGPGVRRLARRLGLRSTAEDDAGARLVACYRRTAEFVRARFEHHVAPVAAPAPWKKKASEA